LNSAAVEVVAAVIERPDGRFLLAQRPAGKVYAGYWEFPGGKVETGESLLAALARELHEELGIMIGPVVQWKTDVVDYPHALVRLHFCKVFDWSGELLMREQQLFSWQKLPVQLTPVLPGALPVLAWLEQEVAGAGSSRPASSNLT